MRAGNPETTLLLLKTPSLFPRRALAAFRAMLISATRFVSASEHAPKTEGVRVESYSFHLVNPNAE